MEDSKTTPDSEWGKPPFNLQLNIQITQGQSDWLDRECVKLGMGVSAFVRYCLLQYKLKGEQS